jgi:outer membrane protein assembly factor BamB
MKTSLCLATLLTIICHILAAAADWPAFRGPAHDGKSPETAVPTRWGPNENIRWQTPLPQPGNGSPIVVQGRVLVTSAEDAEGRQRSLWCFDAASGKSLWAVTARIDRTMPTHQTNPYCATTPASDGHRVVVWHASAGLHCYDLDGNALWMRDLGEFRHMWGYATSPILHRGKVILHSGPGKRVFLMAIDLADGETIWETDEPLGGFVDRNRKGKYMGSWSTPVIAEVNGADQILLGLTTRVNAYDFQTGEIIWSCDGLNHERGDLSYSSPLIVDDLCFVTGGFRGPAMAIRLGGSGNITDTHRLWRTENNPQNIGSGVVAKGYVYRPNAGPGTIDCLDPKTGETKWSERGTGNYWASIVMAGGNLYATSQDATTTVFKPNPERFEPVATNRLDGSCNATPAIADGCLYFRTDKALVCVGH